MTLHACNSAEFIAININCDNKYKKLVNNIKDNLDANIEYVNIQKHETVTEQNIFIIKKQIYTIYHDLLFQYLLKLILEYMYYELATKLNIFPIKLRMLLHYSPYIIIDQTIELQYSFPGTIWQICFS